MQMPTEAAPDQLPYRRVLRLLVGDHSEAQCSAQSLWRKGQEIGTDFRCDGFTGVY